MDFWNTLSSGLDRFADKLDSLTGNHTDSYDDSSFDLMDKQYCWEDLDFAGDYTLQRHVVSGEARIVDKYGAVVEKGPLQTLEESMIRRTAAAQAQAHAAPISAPLPLSNDPLWNSWNTTAPVQAQYGDIIGVVRKAYTHYGIYLSDTCVIHYAIPASKTIGHPTIHPTSLRLFLRDDASDYFILDFPKPYQPPVELGANTPQHTETDAELLARKLQQTYGYHLYSPEETVARAKSRVGETHYNLLTNNCEHFAIWCKTGVSESLQITDMLHSLGGAKGFQFHKPFKR